MFNENAERICYNEYYTTARGGKDVFQLHSEYKPTGDQPQAIDALTSGLEKGLKHQVLLGVTGSGKTFTMANIIKNANRPALVIAHNKTLAAQLAAEFREFFPENAVGYFVSYYDYYQPEAYIPSSDTFIEKDASVNDEIDRMRHSATAWLSERRDVVIVASVSCIYGLGDPEEYEDMSVSLREGAEIDRDALLRRLVDMQYTRNDFEPARGTFRVRGDIIDIIPAAAQEKGVRVELFGDEIERIAEFEITTGKALRYMNHVMIFPASHYATSKEKMDRCLDSIEQDLEAQVAMFRENGRLLEAQRLEQRTHYDLAMMHEIGYCNGIENYSRYFDGRKAGVRPFCLLDYFPEDFLMVIDESHVTLPQIRAMYGGDHARKLTLVDYGFRLPAAFDNRPLTFDEFESKTGQTIYISATPADYELEKSEGIIVEQIIRPTGIPDPVIEIVPSKNQIDHLVNEIQQRIDLRERTLVTTLTKRMAEELSKYLDRIGIKCQYIHSDVDTIERVKILENLRKGIIDVLIGVNLLREGLDLPEVSLVAILDADKEGFLRSTRSLTQTAGRAARNVDGKVIMYADQVTRSMQETIDETNYRREKQLRYNEEHHIVPRQIYKSTDAALTQDTSKAYVEEEHLHLVADPVVAYMSKPEIEKMIQKTKAAMQKAAKELDFIEAARLRDEMFQLEKKRDEMK